MTILRAAALALALTLTLDACAEPIPCERAWIDLASDAPAELDFDGRGFHERLDDALADLEIKGYGFALGDRGGALRATGCGGLSRDEFFDRRSFTPRTHNNWGSVSKMVTAAATLHAVDHTPGASLDDPFGDYLPARWRALLHPDYQVVTISDLLQHRGGFARDGEIYALDEDGEVVDLLAARLAAPAELPAGERVYSNISPILLHFVVAGLTAPAAVAEADARLSATYPGDDYSKWINLAAADIYVEYARTNLLDPAGVDGGCNITAFPEHAYYYPDADCREGAYPREELGGEHTDECSAGGWVLSPRGMLRLFAALRHGGALLSPETYALMENPEDDGARALGYSARSVEDGLAFCHGGLYQHAVSALCSFPNGYQVAITVNSALAGGSSTLIERALTAYDASLLPR